MIARYPALYRDAHGEEATVIENDGKTLRMVVRGVEFTGTMFDDFEPSIARDDPVLASFTLHFGMLCACAIECEMPLPIKSGEELIEGQLRIHLGLREAPPNAEPDWLSLRLALTIGNQTFSAIHHKGWFEDDLREIQALLPDDTCVQCCFNCAFSDYSPYGNGLFGCLACFRDNKDAYRSVHSKHDLLSMWDTMTEFVQETYLCPEFELRTPGSGYRG